MEWPVHRSLWGNLVSYIKLGNIYRPPKHNNNNKTIANFLDEIRPYSNKLVKANLNSIITSDLNLDLLKIEERETRQIWGIWKLRPAYSPETPNLGQNRWCFVPYDLEIWWMTLENNRAPLLCCFKLCATFHSHRWIQTGVAVRKRPIWVKFDNF